MLKPTPTVHPGLRLCPLASLMNEPSSLLAGNTSLVWVLIIASCASSYRKPDLASRARVIEIARRYVPSSALIGGFNASHCAFRSGLPDSEARFRL